MDARQLLVAVREELLTPPRLSIRWIVSLFFLLPLVEGATHPLQSVGATAAIFVALAIVRFGQLLLLCVRVVGKGSTDAPRAVRLQVEQRVRCVAATARHGVLGIGLAFAHPPLAALWTLWQAAACVLEAVAPFSSHSARAAALLGVAAAPVAAAAGADPASPTAGRGKPAKHRTNRYEVIDEGPHFGRVARGSLRQDGGGS
jgi:hypothetical protein